MDWISVQGLSMSPILRPRDEIGVEWIDSALTYPSLAIGSLTLSKSSGCEWVVHRVVKEIITPGSSESSWIIKGDCSFAQETLSHQEIWGIVRKLRRNNQEVILPQNPVFLDTLIARLSSLTVPPDLFRSRVLRKFLGVLTHIRSRSL
jgi:hypothetical protein